MTKHEPSAAEKWDQLVQENEELRAANEELTKRLQIAQEILKPKWKEHAKLLAVFGDAPVTEATSSNGDPLARFRPLLENTNREANRKVAQTIADMGGRATVKQLASATGYSLSTVKNAVQWLKGHSVVYKDGTQVVIDGTSHER